MGLDSDSLTKTKILGWSLVNGTMWLGGGCQSYSQEEVKSGYLALIK